MDLRGSWRVWLLVADVAAIFLIVPWHRVTNAGDLAAAILAMAFLCGPLFAWLLVARTPRIGLIGGTVQLGLLAVLYVGSQFLLSGPVRPPVADWALFFAGLASIVVILGAILQRIRLRPPPLGGGGVLVICGLLAALASFFIALGHDAEPHVEPYVAELDPGPGWTVTNAEFGCGSAGCFTLTATVAGSHTPTLSDFGWTQKCEPLGGILPRLGFVDWGEHCLLIEGTTVRVTFLD